jgi:DNA primase
MIKKENILQDVLGNSYKTRDELLFHCPFCKHHKRKLSVNLDKSVFKCWVCDTKGGISYLVKRFGTINNRHDWELLNQEIDMSSVETMFAENNDETKQVVDLPKQYLCLARRDLPYSAKEALSYLMSRGIPKSDILYYKMGYCDTGKYRKRIIIPSFDESGDCNYFSARTYGTDWLKYKNPPSTKNIIFNDLLVDWDSPITLVEGAFDAIKIKNSIPILGSTLNENTKLFKKIATKQPKVYLGLDKDALTKSLQMIFSMLEYGIDVYFLDTTKIDDIGSITKLEAERLKENSKPMNTENIFNIYWSN